MCPTEIAIRVLSIESYRKLLELVESWNGNWNKTPYCQLFVKGYFTWKGGHYVKAGYGGERRADSKVPSDDRFSVLHSYGYEVIDFETMRKKGEIDWNYKLDGADYDFTEKTFTESLLISEGCCDGAPDSP